MVVATEKLSKIYLKRYVANLPHSKHAEYQNKDKEMPDCPICLVTFAPDDEIIAYECDPKHYFHAKCALEWLQTKPECPLCRTEFTEKIK